MKTRSGSAHRTRNSRASRSDSTWVRPSVWRHGQVVVGARAQAVDTVLTVALPTDDDGVLRPNRMKSEWD
jgi:hypothetical protein